MDDEDADLQRVWKEFGKHTEAGKLLYNIYGSKYGLDTSLKIYSGGLGILAGDYLKETSDMNVNLVAVGLFYRYGYFTQMLSAQGAQVSKYDAQDFMKTPAEPVRDAEGNWVTVRIAFPGRNINARLWLVKVGRTDLYLLDTDYEDNLQEDREVTYHLYGGDWENRLKQELLLGVGGIRALRKLGLNPQVYHCNEGHAANGFPLGAEADEKCVKYLFIDSGLLLAVLGMDYGNVTSISEAILIGNAADLVNKGHITEMVAGLEIIKNLPPDSIPSLYFWMREAKGSMAEVDYILSKDMKILPVEVKAEVKGGMKSLYSFVEAKGITHAVRTSLENFGQFTKGDCTIDIYPLYALQNLLK